MILGANSLKPWNKWDRLLATAYQVLEMERCPQCGMYRWICNNEDSDIRFRLEHDFCGAKATVDYENEQNAKKPGYKPEAGVRLRPEFYVASGKDVSDYREPYYLNEMKRRQEIEASLTVAT